MSAIKTVYVLYKAITSNLKQGNEEVLKSNDKVSKSLKGTSDYTEDFVNKLKGLAKEIAVTSGIVYTASQFVSDFKNALNYGRELSVSSNVLNINAEELQAWGNVLQHVGGDLNTFKTNVGSLASYFNIRADRALTLLPMLADAFKQLNPQQAQIMGNMYGLSPEFVLLLRNGSKELSNMLNAQRALGLATQDDVNEFGKLNNSIIDAKNASKGLLLTLALDSSPDLNKFFETSKEIFIFLRKNKESFEDGLKGIGIGIVGAISVVIPPLGVLASAILAVVAAYKAWQSLDIQNVSQLLEPENFKNQTDLSRRSLKDMLPNILKFNSDTAQPLATQTSNAVNTTNSQVNYTQNNNIENLNTNIRDAAGFARQLNNTGNFSPAYQNSMAQNNFSSGVQ
jgi:hypothetical protein